MGCHVSREEPPLRVTTSAVEIGTGYTGEEAWERSGAQASLLLPAGTDSTRVPGPLTRWLAPEGWQTMCKMCLHATNANQMGNELVRQLGEHFKELSFSYSTRKWKKTTLHVIKADTMDKPAPLLPVRVIYVCIPEDKAPGQTLQVDDPGKQQVISVTVPPGAQPGSWLPVRLD
mmetsp:Transcript_64535/g.183205  ORF Transcript_64535/g.183205 Transcript_64535/m.183205 type:complete len:174 (-) Transcript_64535:105-626(-)